MGVGGTEMEPAQRLRKVGVSVSNRHLPMRGRWLRFMTTETRAVVKKYLKVAHFLSPYFNSIGLDEDWFDSPKA